MAKRAASDEKPFRPLDASILQSVIGHSPSSTPPPPIVASPPPQVPQRAPEPKVVELQVPVAQRPPAMFEAPKQMTRTPDPLTQRLDQEKRILFTREESHAMERLIHNLAVRLNAQVKVSHIIRALTMLTLRAEAQIDIRAGEKGPLTRPPNGDLAAMQRFEREIATILAHALRDAGVPS